MKLIQENKKVNFSYHILERLEVGIALESYEIKQVVDKKCDIKQSFAKIVKGEVILFEMNIQKYDSAVFYYPLEEKRARKLLLHKREIKNFAERLKLEQHLTLVPYKIYINDKGLCKLELCLCKGKKEYDKRDAIKQRDLKLEENRRSKDA